MLRGYYNYKIDKIFIDITQNKFLRILSFIHEYGHKFIYKILPFEWNKYFHLFWDLLCNDFKHWKFYFTYWKEFHFIAFGGGGKKGSEEVTIDYHWVFSLSEVICYEKPLISFEARLGNMVLIGDGSTTSTNIPSYWLKKYFYSKGYGYIKTYPYSIRLYKNNLETELVENTDYTYSNTTGEINFLFTPQIGDFIAGTWTYDEEYRDDTTFYADFAFNNLYKRVGFKYYKHKDDGLNDYRKCAIKAKYLLSELYKPIISGTYDIVFNPKVQIGNSIYIAHQIPNVYRIFFIDRIKESHSKLNHRVEIGGLSFPELYSPLRYKQEQGIKRLNFEIPETIITFIGTDRHTDGFYLTGRANQLGFSDIDKAFLGDLRLIIKKSDEYKLFPGTGFEPNTKNIAIFDGRFYQWYDISFTNPISSYEEFDDENIFFAKRIVNFEVYNASNTYETNIKAETMFIGRKELIDHEYNLSPYAEGDHIVFIDKDDDVWLSDYRFATQKIASLESNDGSSSSIVLMGAYIHSLFLFDKTLKELDIDTGEWNILSELTNNYPLKMPNRKWYRDTNDNMYIYSQAEVTGSIGHYNNLLDFIKYKNGIITEFNWSETDQEEYVGGLPFIFDRWCMWGKYGWDLATGDKGSHPLLTMLPEGIPSIYYADDYSKAFLCACVCMDKTNSPTDTYASGKKWRFYKRPSNLNTLDNWILLGIVEFTNDMIVIPLGLTPNGLILYIKGQDLQFIIHPDTDCAIGVLNENNETIDLKFAKVGGEADSIYNKAFFIDNRLYVNWKDYTNINTLETIGIINI